MLITALGSPASPGNMQITSPVREAAYCPAVGCGARAGPGPAPQPGGRPPPAARPVLVRRLPATHTHTHARAPRLLWPSGRGPYQVAPADEGPRTAPPGAGLGSRGPLLPQRAGNGPSRRASALGASRPPALAPALLAAQARGPGVQPPPTAGPERGPPTTRPSTCQHPVLEDSVAGELAGEGRCPAAALLLFPVPSPGHDRDP